MPVTKSAVKAARQNIKHYKRNLTLKRRMKADVKALLNALAEGQKDVKESLQKAQSTIDKAVKNNLIHKNKAARMKSGLAQKAKAGPTKATATKKTAAKTPTKKPAAKKTTKS